MIAASLLAPRSTDRDGTPLLPVLATPAQRGELMSRQRELAGALAPAKQRELAETLSEMFIGFNVRDDVKTAAARVTQFTTVLQMLPLWAVKRACGRFSRGDVTPDELGDRAFNRGFPPSTAQLHLVASRIVQHFRDEAADIREVLRARLAYQPSPEEQARVAAGLKQLALDVALKPVVESHHERQYRVRGEYLAEKRERALGPSRRDVSGLEASPDLLRTMAEQDARRAAIPAKPEHADEGR